jgi:hypothetical protein
MLADDQPNKPAELNEKAKSLEWLTPAEAVRRLSHREERELVYRVYNVSPKGDSPLYHFAGLLLSRRLQRLDSEIDAYRLELNGLMSDGAPKATELSKLRHAIDALLVESRQCANRWQIDKGWKCLHAAKRLHVLGILDDQSSGDIAKLVRTESSKLSSWRKNAVHDLLDEKNKPNNLLIYLATIIRDEQYDNEAYKDGLRRRQAALLGLVLLCALALAISWASANKDSLLSVSDEANFGTLLGAATLGLLGATVSAILAAPNVGGSIRIPEMVAAWQVTVLRLLMGPAAATLLFFVIHSDLYRNVFKLEHLNTSAVLAISFVAGFSERLVLRVVETIAKKP